MFRFPWEILFPSLCEPSLSLLGYSGVQGCWNEFVLPLAKGQ